MLSYLTRLLSPDRRPPGTETELLRERNRCLDSALNNMTQGLCMFDANERIVVLNRRFLEMYRLSPDIARPGCTLIELLRHRRAVGLLDAEPDKYYAALKADLAKGRTTNWVLQTTDDRYILAHNQPMPGGGWVTTHEDITERRRAEDEVRDQKLKLDAAINNMSQGLCMYDAQQRVIFCNERYLEMYRMSAEDAAPGRTLWELIEMRNARGLFTCDPQQFTEKLAAGFAEHKAVHFIINFSDGRTVSVANLPMPDGRWVSTHEDITEQRRAEAQMHEQSVQLDAALNNMSQGLCMFDAEGRVALANSRYAEMMGVTVDWLMNRTFAELMHHRKASGQLISDPDKLAAAVLRGMREGRSETKIIERGDGRVHEVFRRSMPGGGWVATIEDVTDRRIAQERLRDQKVQLDAALNNMSQGLCMYDAEGRIVLFNARFAEIVGVPSETLRGMAFIELLKRRHAVGDFAGDPEKFGASVFKAVREGQAVTKISHIRGGQVHRIVVHPLLTGGWVTTVEDITEQQRAEAQINEQRIQLDTALNNMSQGLNMFDEDGRLVVRNDRYLEIYRLTADEVKPGCSFEELIRARMAHGTFFADTDPESYMAELREAMRKREPKAAEKVLPDGRIISMFSRPTPDGKGWVVTHEDITERRRAEKERDRSQAFASTVVENVPSTIVVKDARTLRYVLVNRAGEAYFGAQRETMIGKTAEEIFNADTARVIGEHDRDLLRTGEAQFYDEHPTTTPGAGPRIVTTTRTPIHDEQGEISYLLTVIEDRTNRKRAEAQIAHMAHHDPLTGLPNRAAFNECLSSTIETAAKDGTAFALMTIDVDRFKEINDVFGFVVGDDMLCEVARRLQRNAGGAFLARLGGDEFTVISVEGDQPAAAEALANQFLLSVAKEANIDDHQLRAAISIGISIFPTDGEDAGTLVANADAALYRAKSEGRGIYRFFEAGMDQNLRERRALQHDLQSAIERGELKLNYQPQAKISGELGSDIVGFEALVRWKHPARGMISPGTFIPLAEESGLIVPMGEWILREACREAASWKKPLTIGINLSPIQFTHGDLPALVHSVLLETGLAPSRLELEITEGVLIGDFSRAVAILRRLKALGVRIAMDDFGTGYSSLSYLQSFPFDKIKIDRAFISNLETNAQSATIIRAVIGLARGLSLPVLAEGVETEEQRAFLARESCDEIQGYLIGRPLPIEEYAELTGASPAQPRAAEAKAAALAS